VTRDEAVKLWLTFGQHRMEADFRERLPQGRVNEILSQNAEDVVDGLIALKILTVDPPSPLDSSQDPAHKRSRSRQPYSFCLTRRRSRGFP
jgi:hypothetical protein